MKSSSLTAKIGRGLCGHLIQPLSQVRELHKRRLTFIHPVLAYFRGWRSHSFTGQYIYITEIKCFLSSCTAYPPVFYFPFETLEKISPFLPAHKLCTSPHLLIFKNDFNVSSFSTILLGHVIQTTFQTMPVKLFCILSTWCHSMTSRNGFSFLGVIWLVLNTMREEILVDLNNISSLNAA